MKQIELQLFSVKCKKIKTIAKSEQTNKGRWKLFDIVFFK